MRYEQAVAIDVARKWAVAFFDERPHLMRTDNNPAHRFRRVSYEVYKEIMHLSSVEDAESGLAIQDHGASIEYGVSDFLVRTIAADHIRSGTPVPPILRAYFAGVAAAAIGQARARFQSFCPNRPGRTYHFGSWCD